MRLMDIRTLKLKCRDLMRDLKIARGSSTHMDELRRETFQLQRDLLQARPWHAGGPGAGCWGRGRSESS